MGWLVGWLVGDGGVVAREVHVHAAWMHGVCSLTPLISPLRLTCIFTRTLLHSYAFAYKAFSVGIASARKILFCVAT